MTTKAKKEPAAPAFKPRGKVSKTVRFDPDHVSRAEQIATRKGIDFSAYLQMALSEKLERESK